MAKKVLANIKLQINAGKANPAPPVGPALGQHGVNIMEFCNTFNERTKEQVGLVKTPPASILLLKAAGLESGSKEPGKTTAGTVSLAKVREIAEMKMTDLNAGSVEAAMKIIAGTARSMGLEVR